MPRDDEINPPAGPGAKAAARASTRPPWAPTRGSKNGDEGIAKSKTELPDLILMDIIMPGTDGFKATRAITHDEATKHIPVIVCTSKKLETDRVWGMRQGARDYVVKPVDAKELLAKIAALG